MTIPTEPPPTPAPGAPLLDDAGATAQRQLVLAAARARHWQRCARLSAVLLLVWLATTFGSVFFARELAGLTVFGWPLSFYLAAQGAALIYLAIVGAYAFWMRRFDREFHRRVDLRPGAIGADQGDAATTPAGPGPGPGPGPGSAAGTGGSAPGAAAPIEAAAASTTATAASRPISGGAA